MPISDRKKASIRKKKKKAIELMDKTLQSLENKIDSGKSLNQQELQSLRFIIKEIPKLEYAIVETKEEQLEEGKLKEYIEKLWKLTEMVFGVNTKAKLTNEVWDKVFYDMGYYRCSACNEIHLKDRICVFEEYKEALDKGRESEVDDNGELSE